MPSFDEVEPELEAVDEVEADDDADAGERARFFVFHWLLCAAETWKKEFSMN